MPDPARLPVSVELESGRPVITCLDVGNAAFAEPFFHQTIELARAAAPVITPHEELRASLDPLCEPAGFIFHMSRCGSTLVSQLLKEIPGVRVYSEPPPINQALCLTSQLPRREVRDLLEALIRAFCSPSTCVFFKFSSWNVLDYALFDELFPHVPKLLMVRRPVEVLASIARTLPGFVTNRDVFAKAAHRRAGHRAGALEDVEFAAVMLGLFLDAMAAAGNDSTRVLDFTELPSAAWRTLPSFFGIRQDELDASRMEAVGRIYSKSDSVRVPFEKRNESTTHADRRRLQRHVATWIESRYDDLLALRTSS